MNYTRLNFSLILLILTFLYSCSTKIDKTIDFTEVDRLMESAIADSVFPGAVLLFGKDRSGDFTAKLLAISPMIKTLLKYR